MRPQILGAADLPFTCLFLAEFPPPHPLSISPQPLLCSLIVPSAGLIFLSRYRERPWPPRPQPGLAGTVTRRLSSSQPGLQQAWGLDLHSLPLWVLPPLTDRARGIAPVLPFPPHPPHSQDALLFYLYKTRQCAVVVGPALPQGLTTPLSLQRSSSAMLRKRHQEVTGSSAKHTGICI